MPVEFPTLDITHADAQAESLLECFQIWGMDRLHAKIVCKAMLRKLRDDKREWKDLRGNNRSETEAMLMQLAEAATVHDLNTGKKPD